MTPMWGWDRLEGVRSRLRAAWRRVRDEPLIGIACSLAFHVVVVALILYFGGPRSTYAVKRGEPLFVELPEIKDEALHGNPAARTPGPPEAPAPPARPAPPAPRVQPSPPRPAEPPRVASARPAEPVRERPAPTQEKPAPRQPEPPVPEAKLALPEPTPTPSAPSAPAPAAPHVAAAPTPAP